MIKVILGSWASICFALVLIVLFIKLIMILYSTIKNVIKENDRKYFYVGFIGMTLLTFGVLLAITLGY